MSTGSNTYTEFQFAVSESEYADDTAIPFCNRADAEKYAPLLMEHFRRWGLEVHAGSYHPFKGAKTELLFVLASYQRTQIQARVTTRSVTTRK